VIFPSGVERKALSPSPHWLGQIEIVPLTSIAESAGQNCHGLQDGGAL